MGPGIRWAGSKGGRGNRVGSRTNIHICIYIYIYISHGHFLLTVSYYLCAIHILCHALVQYVKYVQIVGYSMYRLYGMYLHGYVGT